MARPSEAAASPAPVTPQPGEGGFTNRVLNLDGNGSYVELPPNIFTNLTEGTVEAWVKWRSRERFQRFFSFGQFLNDMGVGQQDTQADLHFFVSSQGVAKTAGVARSPSPFIALDQWHHIAAVSGKSGMKLYCN